jgi:hypothetical protein
MRLGMGRVKIAMMGGGWYTAGMATLSVVAVPSVYAGRYNRQPVGRLTLSGRLLALVLSAGCLSLLVMSAGLTPSPGGYGTHRQLGMQECGFLARTGLPCPACGMTTSFAWFAHGNLIASFYVQPMGCALAILCAMCVWAGAYVAITGKPLNRVLSVVPDKLFLIPLFVLATAGWGWKMYIHLHGIDGWR